MSGIWLDSFCLIISFFSLDVYIYAFWFEDLTKTMMVNSIIFLYHSFTLLFFHQLITFSPWCWIVGFIYSCNPCSWPLNRSPMFGSRYFKLVGENIFISNIYSHPLLRFHLRRHICLWWFIQNLLRWYMSGSWPVINLRWEYLCSLIWPDALSTHMHVNRMSLSFRLDVLNLIGNGLCVL